MPRRCPPLDRENPEAFVEINPENARRLDLEPGGVVRATTRRGAITAKAWVTKRIKPGVLFIPMHFMENTPTGLPTPPWTR